MASPPLTTSSISPNGRGWNPQGPRYNCLAQSRFHMAPISKLWCGFTICGRALWLFHRMPSLFGFLDTDSLLLKALIWIYDRLFFANISTAMVGCLLIYSMRHVERRLGSRRYLDLIILSSLLGYLFESIASALFTFDGSPISFASGPFIPLISAFVQFMWDVPHVPFASFVLPVSLKNLPCLFALQLIFSDRNGITSALIGAFTGLVIRATRLHILMPVLPENLFDRFLHSCPMGTFYEIGEDKVGTVLPIGATIDEQRRELMERYERQMMMAASFNRRNANQEVDGMIPFLQRMLRGEGAAARLDWQRSIGRSIVEPRQEDIDRLTSMGFNDSTTVAEALRAHGNDINGAVQQLLMQANRGH